MPVPTLITPTTIERIAWEGELSSSTERYGSSDGATKVTLGQPTHWTPQALEALTGTKWTAPANGRLHTLIRLDSTLHPPAAGQRYREATLIAEMRPIGSDGRALAHDLLPQRKLAEEQGKFTIKLAPSFKFADGSGIEAGEASVEIQHHNVYPTIQAFGLGEDNPYWQFSRHDTQPLLGTQSVYLVASLPAAAVALRLKIALLATVESNRFGLSRLLTPDTANSQLNFNLPMHL